MQLTDFLKNLTPNPMPVADIAYEAGLLEHLDAYLLQRWPQGRVILVAELGYRDVLERRIVPQLRACGIETAYCLCVRSTESYKSQIEEALGGAREDYAGIVALGSPKILYAAGALSQSLDIGLVGVLNVIPPQGLFETLSQHADASRLEALYVDLSSLSLSPSDWREAILALELHARVLHIELIIARALGAAPSGAVQTALREAIIPPIPHDAVPNEEDLAELCEACAWLGAARLAYGRDTALATVQDYIEASSQSFYVPPLRHAQIAAQIIDAFAQMEALEIDPEYVARHVPPLDIQIRTARQILIEDEVDFAWLKRVEALDEDRVRVRHRLQSLIFGWDDMMAGLQPQLEMLHALIEANLRQDDAVDTSIKTFWLHAAKFASHQTWLRLMDNLRLLEGILFE